MPKEVDMKVPEDMLAEMQAYMEKLKISTSKKTLKEEEKEE
jgi:hypothetical protein